MMMITNWRVVFQILHQTTNEFAIIQMTSGQEQVRALSKDCPLSGRTLMVMMMLLMFVNLYSRQESGREGAGGRP